MARAREVKPGFFSDEDIGQLSRDARLLFIGLWTLADREGRLEDRPLKIRAELFPYDQDLNVEAHLGELARPKVHGQSSAAFVTRYVGPDGRRYLQVSNFARIQHLHPKEAPSRIPPPPGPEAGTSRDQPRQVRDEPRQDAESRGSSVASRSGLQAFKPSGPSGPSAAASSLPPSEQGEGGVGGGVPPARAAAVRELEASALGAARMELAAAAARVAAHPFGGGNPEELLRAFSRTEAGASFGDPDDCPSIPWLRVTLDRVLGHERENQARTVAIGARWEPVYEIRPQREDRGPPATERDIA